MDDAMDSLALLRSIKCPFTAKQSHELRALVDSSSESGSNDSSFLHEVSDFYIDRTLTDRRTMDEDLEPGHRY